ncbi:MAG: VOC family protein [Bacteroidales bacterium]
MIIDHICIAVRNLEQGIEYWEQIFGYSQMTNPVVNSIQKVRVVFLSKKGSLPVKLIEPMEGNQSLHNFVNRGGGFHHLCFRCENVGETVKDLGMKGLITLSPPQPGEAFNNHPIAFMFARDGLNIELIDTNEKAEVISFTSDRME